MEDYKMMHVIKEQCEKKTINTNGYSDSNLKLFCTVKSILKGKQYTNISVHHSITGMTTLKFSTYNLDWDDIIDKREYARFHDIWFEKFGDDDAMETVIAFGDKYWSSSVEEVLKFLKSLPVDAPQNTRTVCIMTLSD